jgi:hypothetical protein
MQPRLAVVCVLLFLVASCDGVEQGTDSEQPDDDVTSTQQYEGPSSLDLAADAHVEVVP